MRLTRRNVYAKRTTTAYAVVWDLEWHLIECRRLDPGSDLYAALSETVDALEADGWHPEFEHAHGFVFVRQGAERRLVTVTGRDPYSDTQQSFNPFRTQRERNDQL
jgi:hypothetical protein